MGPSRSNSRKPACAEAGELFRFDDLKTFDEIYFTQLTELDSEGGERIFSGSSEASLVGEDKVLDDEQIKSLGSIFLKRSNIVCEGIVLASSRLKVVRTRPCGVLGYCLPGKTRLSIDFPIDSPSEKIGFLKRVALSLIRVDSEDEGRATYPINLPAVDEDRCFRYFKSLYLRIRSAGAQFHLTEGQTIFGCLRDHWFVVKACQPACGGLLGPETLIHFNCCKKRIQHVHTVGFELTGNIQNSCDAELKQAIQEYLEGAVPRNMTVGGTIHVPNARKKIGSSSKTDTELARVSDCMTRSTGSPGRYSSSCLNSFDAFSASTLHCRIVSISPESDSGLYLPSSNFFIVNTSGNQLNEDSNGFSHQIPIMTSVSRSSERISRSWIRSLPVQSNESLAMTRDPNSRADRCLLCNSLVCPPTSATNSRLLASFGAFRRSTVVYLCPCGQPVTNGNHPFWSSVDDMAGDPTMSTRPSVVFLSELRQAIGLMPLSDPRSFILRQSLMTFPCLASGSVNFDAADALILMTAPSQLFLRGVSQSRLSQFPICNFSEIKDTAMSRNETQCPICMTRYLDADQLRTLPCLHFYHMTCIDSWFRANTTCPICKHDVS